MIKKIIILIFFIVSSANPLFACETEKIKKKCNSQRAKNMELEIYQTTIGMTQAFLKQAACITKGINDKFNERYDGEKWHYHDHWNPNIHITPTKSAEMFTKLLHIYYETYIEMEQAKGNGIRATAWIRDAVYKELERELPASVYKEAKAKDEAVWRESVRRRVEGRNNPDSDALPNDSMS